MRRLLIACERETARDEAQRRHIEAEALAGRLHRRAVMRKVCAGLVCWFGLNWFVWGFGCTSSRQQVVAEVPPAEQYEVPDSPPDVWATDGEAPDAGFIARPMPSGPFKGQKKPDARTHLCGGEQVAIKGGCWETLERRPRNGSCGSGAFEHEGKCYIPVREAGPAPVGMEP